MDLEDAYHSLRTMEEDFENWYRLEEDEDIAEEKEQFSHTKLMLELGEYDEGDYEYLKWLVSRLPVEDEYYYETIMTFIDALSREYLV